MPEYKAVMANPFADLMCEECGALVGDEAIHNEWHEKMDELIDWAQDVSEHFVHMSQPKPKGTPLGPNPGLLK
jgi:hypothetical protein